jgi:PadR family transcriptional regulator PadR
MRGRAGAEASGMSVTRGDADDLPSGLPRNYLRTCLLLLLAEGTSHGYELLDQVVRLGLDRVEPGGLYRCLRSMEQEGLVRSKWEPSTSGPARRTYELTEDGTEWLHLIAGSLDDAARWLNAYRGRYQRVVDRTEHSR